MFNSPEDPGLNASRQVDIFPEAFLSFSQFFWYNTLKWASTVSSRMFSRVFIRNNFHSMQHSL
jgi:hypothetical protein